MSWLFFSIGLSYVQSWLLLFTGQHRRCDAIQNVFKHDLDKKFNLNMENRKNLYPNLETVFEKYCSVIKQLTENI